MAYRLTISDHATREIGEAYEWYQQQRPGLGVEIRIAVAQLDTESECQDKIIAVNLELGHGVGAERETGRKLWREALARYPIKVSQRKR